jgi:membrane protein
MDIGGAWNRAYARAVAMPGVKQYLRIQRRFDKDAGGYLAAALSYFFFLSVLPLVLLVMSIAGYALTRVSRPQAVAKIQDVVKELPGIGTVLVHNLNALVDARTWAAVLAVLGIIWTGTGGIAAIRRTLGAVFRFEVPVNSLMLRLRSLGLFLLIGPLVLASTAVVGAGTRNIGSRWWLAALGFALGLALDILIAGTLFRVFTPAGIVPTVDHWPGAVFCGVGFVLTQSLGSEYFARVVRHASLFFGAFASVVGVLVIFNLAARIFLSGAELTAIRLENTGDTMPAKGER